MASNAPRDAPTSAPADRPVKVPSEKELARKIRKRELDRRAQRQARERTRNRISELEAQVKELRKDDSTRLSACMEQLAAVTRERDQLFETFKSIEQTLHSHVLPSRPILSARQPSFSATPLALSDPRHSLLTRVAPLPPPSSSSSYTVGDSLLPETSCAANVHVFHDCNRGMVGSTPSRFLESSAHAPSVHAPSSTSDNQDVVEELDDDDDDDDGFRQDGHDDPCVIVPPPEAPCDCIAARTSAGMTVPKLNIWRAVNQVLAKRCRISKEEHQLEDATDEDIPVRVLLEGWDAVAKSQPLSKLWRKLRRVDELCFQAAPLTERLAMIRTMHLLLQYHSDPTPARYAKLPTWPSQAMPHSYAIDFFVWPGVRERFVFGQHHYCTNDFWDLFGPNFHLLWPFEFRDTYKKSVVTGRYQISPMFQERISDINAWTVGMDFFKRFPELIADIPAFLSVSQSLTPAVSSPGVPQQASLLQLKAREEQRYREEHGRNAGEEEQQTTNDVLDASQTIQLYPGGFYSTAPPVFMDEYIQHGYATEGASGSYGPLPGYY
ncbi:hypothetical protein CCHL11_02132 [Colletotrichum chlorophyti]|uniref:BZIP domain-containing protein n=1 Tax=Colletotrichum chlorophyti TaxID=708187 RepID=A0A1Q8S6W6_9PEZI|nr:hypothetical protein CCHL11_02132 [Colletotrichum chlorophyti]